MFEKMRNNVNELTDSKQHSLEHNYSFFPSKAVISNIITLIEKEVIFSDG